jgi:hypothetical protein
MQMNATVTIEELDSAGNPWRTCTSHMVRANVDQSIAAIRAGYNMNQTRIKVDGQVVTQPPRV